jgi:hypothetical protein
MDHFLEKRVVHDSIADDDDNDVFSETANAILVDYIKKPSEIPSQPSLNVNGTISQLCERSHSSRLEPSARRLSSGVKGVTSRSGSLSAILSGNSTENIEDTGNYNEGYQEDDIVDAAKPEALNERSDDDGGLKNGECYEDPATALKPISIPTSTDKQHISRLVDILSRSPATSLLSPFVTSKAHSTLKPFTAPKGVHKSKVTSQLAAKVGFLRGGADTATTAAATSSNAAGAAAKGLPSLSGEDVRLVTTHAVLHSRPGSGTHRHTVTAGTHRLTGTKVNSADEKGCRIQGTVQSAKAKLNLGRRKRTARQAEGKTHPILPENILAGENVHDTIDSAETSALEKIAEGQPETKPFIKGAC